MPIPIACPECDARLEAPDDAAGRTIRCPKCTARMVVPDREDENDRPRPRVRPRDDDESDDRPRPRKRRKPAKSGGVPAWLTVVGGVGLLALTGVSAWLALGNKKGDGDKPGGAGVQGAAAVAAGGRAAPAGFTAVVEPDGGYEVFLPGEVGKVDHGGPTGPIPRTDTAGWYGFNDMGNLQIGAVARAVPPGTPGKTEADLLAVLERFHYRRNPFAGTEARRMTTLGGRPALEVRYNEESGRKAAARFVLLVTVKGNKAYVVETKVDSGKDPDARHDQVVESFRFR
ncbi:MAG: zinc-ribbon domain-containing protein [Gemmataceae bacterium]|nr:zinc-ribbon domain-containing protein [Gemmataceae bacterium]